MFGLASRRGMAVCTGLAVFYTLGCGEPDRGITVTGNVTYDGKLLERGSIAFHPVDTRTGAAAGGEVRGGKYKVTGILPGKMRVYVSDIRSQGQLVPTEKRSYVIHREQGEAAGANKPSGEGVPRNAIGQDQIVEVTADKRTHDFDLQKPHNQK
jgi:hypothetical protein